jgi:hypothetical protein
VGDRVAGVAQRLAAAPAAVDDLVTCAVLRLEGVEAAVAVEDVVAVSAVQVVGAAHAVEDVVTPAAENQRVLPVGAGEDVGTVGAFEDLEIGGEVRRGAVLARGVERGAAERRRDAVLGSELVAGEAGDVEAGAAVVVVALADVLADQLVVAGTAVDLVAAGAEGEQCIGAVAPVEGVVAGLAAEDDVVARRPVENVTARTAVEGGKLPERLRWSSPESPQTVTKLSGVLGFGQLTPPGTVEQLSLGPGSLTTGAPLREVTL